MGYLGNPKAFTETEHCKTNKPNVWFNSIRKCQVLVTFADSAIILAEFQRNLFPSEARNKNLD